MSDSRLSMSAIDSLRQRASLLVTALLLMLIGWVTAWQLNGGDYSASRWGLILLLTLPLWAPLYGVLRRTRRTYAWATLCVIPYFILGVTEAVANPARRFWAGGCLLLALALFAALIFALRVTRESEAD